VEFESKTDRVVELKKEFVVLKTTLDSPYTNIVDRSVATIV
jgi:hypothetical protein